MGLRHVVDIDLNDEKYKQFAASFEKHQKLLEKTPGAWAGMSKEMKSGFATMTAALQAHLDLIKKTDKAEDDLGTKTKRAALSWKDMARSSREFLSNVKESSLALVRWMSLGTIVGGLLGAGSLWGLDRMAAGVSSTRRSALGLGVTFGERRAFDVNYGRVVDSSSYLSNVNAALHDASKRSTLYGVGLTDRDLAGKNTAQVALMAISKLKDIADRTNPALLQQTLQARTQGNLIQLEEFERLRNTSRSELSGYASAYGRDTGALGQSDKTARSYQDFYVQLDRAGEKIEAVFIKGLQPLIPSITKLSDAVASSLATLLSSPDLKKGIEQFGGGLMTVAKYIGSKEFQEDLKTFSEDVGLVAKALVNGLRWLGVIPDSTGSKKSMPPLASGKAPITELARGGNILDVLRDVKADIHGASRPSVVGVAERHHNPGNLRSWKGFPTADGYAQFPDDVSGLRALRRQLELYMRRDHLDTISGIVAKYAPASDKNDVDAYVKDVVRRTGFAAGQHLGSDSTTVAKLMRAIMYHEDTGNAGRVLGNLTQGARIEVHNNTGGNAIVTSSQLPQ